MFRSIIPVMRAARRIGAAEQKAGDLAGVMAEREVLRLELEAVQRLARPQE